MTSDTPAPDGGTFVQSLARGLAVIRAFDAQAPQLSLSDIAQRTGLSRAAARRFLLTLESLGYVRSQGRLFSLTPKVLELGVSYLSGLGFPQVALPHLERLSHALEESVSASVLDGDDIVYVARAAHRRIMSVRIEVGTRFPAYATAMGRVLLAALPPDLWPTQELPALTPRTVTDPSDLHQELRKVREQGWADVDSELELGLRSIAVPVHGPRGLVAAINVAMGSSANLQGAATARHLDMLTETARLLEEELHLAALTATERH